MTTYREFQAELERIHQQSESARRRQKAEAFERIRALIVEYALDPETLGLAAWKWDVPTAPAARKAKSPASGAAREFNELSGMRSGDESPSSG